MAPPRRRPAVSGSQIAEQHLTWLQALPGDGPFLTIPVLTAAFPTGLELTTPERAAQFKHAYAAYRTAPASRQETARQSFITTTVRDVLDWGNHYDPSEATTDRFTHTTAAFNVTTTPAFALWSDEPAEVADDALPVMLGYVWPSDVTLTRRMLDGWAATPIDRAAASLRHHNVPLGLVTNGRSWVIVWAPRGSATGWVLFDTHAMLDDRQLLDAFTSLLSRRRHLAVAETEALNALLNRALDSQEELTENLSVEVRQAVEMLVDSIGAADRDSGGVALGGIDADHVYQGAVTIVMRLVFLLAAEERRLLPGDDDVWISNYGIAGLADRLIEAANHYGEDVLARQSEAFPQVLATSRIVHDGVRHQTLNVKGYGGSVFDPDRYPWLEGRQAGGPGKPVHVDDRTMLHILTGLTRWQGRRLAYRTLDVEQIGYVYEGLLDHTAVKADTTYLGLAGRHEPEVPLEDVEEHVNRGDANLRKWVKDITGLTPAQVNRALAGGAPDPEQDRLLLAACSGDEDLAARIRPYLALLRCDERNSQPIVYLPGDWFVTKSEARSGSGSYYTPRSLAEEVVKHTLDALVYDPGPRQTLDKDQWRIVAPDTILGLKIADIAMGSGAFLVAADRYLADRLIEALRAHPDSTTDPALLDLAGIIRRAAEWTTANDQEADESTLTARRLIATRCLYGSDINPMAVEMAKLSLWLATAAKDRPFGFLDHHLVVGDSLLGLTDVRQIESVHPDPAVGARLHASTLMDQTGHVRSALERAVGTRSALEGMRIHDLRDVEQQEGLLASVKGELADLSLLADALVAEVLSVAQQRQRSLDARMLSLGADGGLLLQAEGSREEKGSLRERLQMIAGEMQRTVPTGGFGRKPLHWILAFPEVFQRKAAGFDAVVGNPPFLRGRDIGRVLGQDEHRWLLSSLGDGKGSGTADLVALFFLRAAQLIGTEGEVGLIATNTIAEGATRDSGLQVLSDQNWVIHRAVSGMPWPAKKASVRVSLVWLGRQAVQQIVLDGRVVTEITASLTEATGSSWRPMRLKINDRQAFKGSELLGDGFLVDESLAEEWKSTDPASFAVVRPFLTGNDLQHSPLATATRLVIDMGNCTEEEAATRPAAFAHLEQYVKPLRQKDRRVSRRRNWWKFGERAAGLYERLEGTDEAIGLSFTSSTLQPRWILANQVIANGVIVFPRPSPHLYGLLCSDVHVTWAIRRAGSLETRLRYTPSDIFSTFPQCQPARNICEAGEQHRLLIETTCRELSVGLSTLYGQVVDASTEDASIVRIRESHVELNRAVLDAYGWSHIAADSVFRGTKFGPRWMISEESEDELWNRLLTLNRELHQEEVEKHDSHKRPKVPGASEGSSVSGGEGSLALFN